MKLTFKSLIAIAVIITILISSCQKTPVDYSKDINDLKALVTELQHRSDSLAAALGNTNTNLSNLSKSVDSIKLKLTDIQNQIDAHLVLLDGKDPNEIGHIKTWQNIDASVKMDETTLFKMKMKLKHNL